MVYNHPKDDPKCRYDLDITFVHGGAHVAKLSRDNYPDWRRVTQGMMEKANCWQIILDESFAVPDTHSSDAFKRGFRVAKGIIVHSCSDSIKRGIDHCEHPRAMWIALEVQFHTSPEAINRRRAINTQFKLSKPTAGIPISEWLRHLLRLQKLVMFSDMMILNVALIRQMDANLPPGPSLNILWTMKKAGDTPKRIIEAIRDREFRARNLKTRTEKMKPWCSYHQQSDDHTSQHCPVLQGRPWVKLKAPGDAVGAERSRRASTGSRSTSNLSNDASAKPNEGPKRQQSRDAINQGGLNVEATPCMSSKHRNSSTDTSSKASRHANDAYATKPYNPAGLWNSAHNPRFNSRGQGKAPETPPKSSTPAADKAFSPITPPPPKGYWGQDPGSEDPFPRHLVLPTHCWNMEGIVHRPMGSGKHRQTQNERPPKRGGSWGPWNDRGKFPNPPAALHTRAPAPEVAQAGVVSTPLLRCRYHQSEFNHTSETCPTLRAKMAERGDTFYGPSTPKEQLPKDVLKRQVLIGSASWAKTLPGAPIHAGTTNTAVPTAPQQSSKINPHATPISPKVLNKDGKLVTPPHLRPIRKTPLESQQTEDNVRKFADVALVEELYIGNDGYMRRRDPSARGTAIVKPLAPKTPSPETSSPTTRSNASPTQHKTKEPEMQFVIGPDGWMRAIPITENTRSPIPKPGSRPPTPRAEKPQGESPLPVAPTSPVLPPIPAVTPESRSQLRELSVLCPSAPRQPPRIWPVVPEVITPPQQVQAPPSSFRMRLINAFCHWYDRVRNRNDDEDAEEFAMAALSVAHHVMTREHWELEDIALFSQHDWDRYIEYHPAMMVMTRAVATYLACLARGMIDEEIQE